MNTALLLKVKEKILAHPEKFDMRYFENETPCGTTFCIGGWAVILSREEGTLKCLEEFNSIEAIARRVLDLSLRESDSLFFVANWPEDFYSRFCHVSYVIYFDAKTEAAQKELAQIAAERIDHFIATGGKE